MELNEGRGRQRADQRPVGGQLERNLGRDGDGPQRGNDEHREPEPDADAGRGLRFGAVLAARREHDHGDQREQPADPRRQHARAVVVGDGAAVDDRVGHEQQAHQRERGDDAERRGEAATLHTRMSVPGRLNEAGFRRPVIARHTTPGAESSGMPLGGVTDKVQKILDTAEELYKRVTELREQVMEVRDTVQQTNERVATLENKLDQQGAVLEALAEHEGIDVDQLVTEVAIEEAEPDPEEDAAEAADDAENPEGSGAIPDAEAGEGSST